EEDAPVDGAGSLADIEDARRDDGARGRDRGDFDGDETKQDDRDHGAENAERAVGELRIGKFGRRPLEPKHGAGMAKVLNLRTLAENEQHVARFEADVVEQGADHAAAALDAEDDAAGLMTEGDLLDGLADHARARRDDRFREDEFASWLRRAAIRF